MRDEGFDVGVLGSKPLDVPGSLLRGHLRRVVVIDEEITQGNEPSRDGRVAAVVQRAAAAPRFRFGIHVPRALGPTGRRGRSLLPSRGHGHGRDRGYARGDVEAIVAAVDAAAYSFAAADSFAAAARSAPSPPTSRLAATPPPARRLSICPPGAAFGPPGTGILNRTPSPARANFKS